MDFPSVDRLLPLSAFALAVPITYLGMDTARKHSSVSAEAAKQIARIALDIFTRLEPVVDGKMKLSLDVFEIYVIAYLSRRDVPICGVGKWFKKHIWLALHCPLFRTYVARRDYLLVWVFFVTSLLLFFLLSATSVFKLEISRELLIASYAYMTLSCVFTFVLIVCSSKMFTATQNVSEIQQALYRHVERIEGEHLDRSMGELERGDSISSDAASNPSTPAIQAPSAPQR